MKTRDGGKPEDVLREYWHTRVESLELPADAVDRAIARAVQEDTLTVHGGVRRPIRRALVNLAGLAVLAAVGLIIVPHLGGGPTGVPTASGAAHSAVQAPAPAAEVVGLAVSAPSHLWVLSHGSNGYVLARRVAGGFETVTAIPGPYSPSAGIRFASARDGLVVVPTGQHQWALWVTGNGGRQWQRVSVPPVSPAYLRLTASLTPGRQVELLFSGASGDRLYSGNGHHWRSTVVRGLPAAIRGVWWSSKSTGSAATSQGIFETHDGGSQWRAVANTPVATAASPHFMTASDGVQPAPMAWVRGRAAGTASAAGAREWMASQGAVWTRTGGGPWQRLSRLPFAGSATALAFLSQRVGYLTGGSGAIWMTQNGGRTWREIQWRRIP